MIKIKYSLLLIIFLTSCIRNDSKQLHKIDYEYVYCQSEIRSACVTFVLNKMMGYQNIRNYDGSWLEWSNSDLPIEKNYS